MASASPPPSDHDVDVDVPVEREGHETLLPSVTRSVASRAAIPMPEAASDTPPPATGAAPGVDRPRGAAPGDLIGGKYLIEGQLGRGGMGRVMRVRHAALGKPFALKLIKSAIATNPTIRELFYREARLASSLTHDNICSIVDFGQDDAFGLFMVMELLEGQTVNARIRHNGRFAAKVACDIMWQVADATRFIHSRQILHGDIKTDNIFMVRTPVQRRLIKLLDFGLSRADLGVDAGLDGTPEYLAPERIDGAPASPASDIYALGIVFFELLTGKLPFTGPMQDVFRQHCDVPCPRPSEHCDGEPLDERADQIIARATAKKPTERHPDVAAFMYELRTLMGMLGMDQSASRRRSALAPDAQRDRREQDQRTRAESELFCASPLPMASVSADGVVRIANPAFLQFLGVVALPGFNLHDSALAEVYPTLFEDLAEAAAQRRTIKRVIYLNEGGDRIVEAAVIVAPAPSSADATAGDLHVVIHPLRGLLS